MPRFIERNLLLLMLMLVAVLIAAMLFASRPARSQTPDPTLCPAATPCKVITMTQQEMDTLVGPSMVFDVALWGNRAGFSVLIEQWREKLKNAPLGKMPDAPKAENKSGAK